MRGDLSLIWYPLPALTLLRVQHPDVGALNARVAYHPPMTLSDEKCLLLTTFRCDGTPVGTLGGLLKGKRIPYGDRGVVLTLSTSA